MFFYSISNHIKIVFLYKYKIFFIKLSAYHIQANACGEDRVLTTNESSTITNKQIDNVHQKRWQNKIIP